MKASHLALSLAFALWSAGAAFANNAPPSDESLREMFKLAHTEETMNGMKPAYNETFSFAPMHLLLIRVYQATYTQDEVDGLIAFYKTPAGQALVNKSPLMGQNLMGEMQAAMRPMMQRIGQIQRETDQEIKALPASK